MSKLFNAMMIRVRLVGDGDEVVTDDNGEVIGTGNASRVAMLNKIGDNADQQRGEEFVELDENDKPTAFTMPEVETAAVEEEAPPAETVETNVAAPAETVPEKILRKVNGVEIEITDELLVKAQKIASADQYLQNARQAAALPQEEVAPAPEPETDLVALARALQMGTEEEAVAALRKLSTRNPSQDGIATQIDERLAFKEALNDFKEKYQDIVSDPRLLQMAEQRDIEQRQAGDKRSYKERYAEIGNELRAWINGKTAPKTAEAEQVNREERKAAAPQPPKATASKHQVQVEDEKDESAADVIAEMAKKRGGPQWMNSAR